MGDPRIDEMLADFLEREREASRKGITLESIAKTQETLADGLIDHQRRDDEQFKELRDKLDVKLASHDHRLTHVEAKMQGIEKDVGRIEETTGSHDVVSILKAARELPSSKTTSKPPLFGKAFGGELARTVAKGLFLLAVGFGGWLFHHLTWNPSPAPQASSAHP